MKKILYITNESDLNRFKDKNRLYRYEAIQKNKNFKCLSANNISKSENPDDYKAVCLSHECSPGHGRYGGSKEFENFISKFDKRVVILEDLQKISRKTDLLNSTYTDIILTVEGDIAEEMKSKMSCDFHSLTHHINTDLIKDYQHTKKYDVLSYGALNHVYPFRSRLTKLLKKSDLKFKRVGGRDGYWGSELGKLINESWLTITTSSTYNYLVCKYFEASGGGSVILGNMDDIGKTIWNEDEYIKVESDMSDDEIISIVKKALDDKDKLMDISKKVGKRIRKEYSTKQYAIKLSKIIRKL